ncbi:MAG: LamG domain-containing protein [Planctomycetota bacterium]
MRRSQQTSRIFGVAVSALTCLVLSSASAEVQTLIHAGLGDGGEASLASPRAGGDGWTHSGRVVVDDRAAEAATRATGGRASLSFNGNEGLLLNPLPATPKTNFGLEAWVRPSGRGGARTILNLGGDGGVGIEQFKDGVWGVVYGRGTVGFRKLPVDRWSHVALVVDGKRTTLYVNGNPAGSADLVPWGYKPATGLSVGYKAKNNTNHYEGLIDEARVFTFAPGGFSTNDLLLHQDRVLDALPTVEASIVFGPTPQENGLTFDRDGTKPVTHKGKPAWSAHQTRMPGMQWMRSFRLTFTDERFRNGSMPVVDLEIEFALDTWGGMEVHGDTARGSSRIGMQWGASPNWKTARFRINDAHFGARDHGSPGNRLSSDGYDLRLYAPNAPLIVRSVKVRGYPLTGDDLAWPRLVKVDRPSSTEGPVLAFEAAAGQGLRFGVNNLAREPLPANYRMQIVDSDDAVVAQRSGEIALEGGGVSELDVPFDADGWAFGPYRYRFTLERPGGDLPIADYEGGLIVHDGAAVERARPDGFLYGVQHTKNIHGDIDQAWFNLLGVDFVRGLPERGRRTQLELYDKAIPVLSEMGMSCMVMVDPPKPGDPRTYVPEGMNPKVRDRQLRRLETFLETLAAKYRDEITYYELGNEPDLKFFYPGPVAEYVDSFRRMRAAIKRGNPDAVVMTGGLCFFREEGDTRAREIIRRLGPDGVDAWSFHAHGPGYESEKEMYEKIRRTVIENAPGGEVLPFVETESGFSAVGAAQLREQARTCIEKFVYAQSVGIPAFAWFATHFEGNSTYTSVESLREPRPVMLAFRTTVQRLRHYDFKQEMELADGRVRGYLFERSDTGGSALVLFATETGGSEPVRLQLGEPGADVTAYDMWNNPTTLTVSDQGVVDLVVNEDTTFLAWRSGDAGSAPREQPPLMRVIDKLVLPHVEHEPKAMVAVYNATGQRSQMSVDGRLIVGDRVTDVPPQAVSVGPGETGRLVLSVPEITGPAAVNWPTVWRVFADRYNQIDARGLDLAKFETIPSRIGGLEGRWAELDEGGRIDLGAIAGGHQEKAPALLFAEVWSPTDQMVRVGTSADWWMQWLVNGQPVYDTLQGGNSGAQTITGHTFDVPLKAGDNLIAVRVLSGSGAWAFVTGGPEAVDAATHGDRAARRLELTLTQDGGELASLTLPLRETATATPLGPRGMPSDMTEWFTRQPLAYLGEADMVNPHLVQPDTSKWWAGPQDASALAWAHTTDDRDLVLIVAVRDEDHVAGQDAVELTLTPAAAAYAASSGETAGPAWSMRWDDVTSQQPLEPGERSLTSVARDEAAQTTWYIAHVSHAELGHATAVDVALTVFDDDGWGAKQRLVTDRLNQRPLTLPNPR